MKTKIAILATDGDSREDGNVYYSRAVIVQSDHLKFDEDIFQHEASTGFGPMPVFQGSFAQAIQHLRDLGYIVHEPDHPIICCTEG